MEESYIYIMSNQRNTVFYTGMSSELIGRVYKHKNKLIKGFTAKYSVTKLVYYEVSYDIYETIKREKQIKGGSRAKKNALIKSMNPEFRDLYEDLIK